ncbi:MAG: hypothetical protein IKH11_01735, partial [Bacteroidales bacterium]|nr:hypothetical protein [Bacteroidales bacterium]
VGGVTAAQAFFERGRKRGEPGRVTELFRGLLQPALPDSGQQETPEKLSDSTRLSTLASAFEERLRSGYTPDDIAS